MLLKEATARLTQSELANIGTGEVGYIRKMDWSEVSRCFPEAPDTFYRAAEDELKTVSLH
jgi:hypothetical protein